jgi:hypothetical protein
MRLFGKSVKYEQSRFALPWVHWTNRPPCQACQPGFSEQSPEHGAFRTVARAVTTGARS